MTADRCGASLGGMTEHISSELISRRSLLRGTATAAAVAAGMPLLSSCSDRKAPAASTDSAPPATDHTPQGTGVANVHVSNDAYGVHVEPSVAINPRDSRQLLIACQVSPTADPEFIATYVSADAGTSWQGGGVPQLPPGASQTGDDVTVAFDAQGRGYVCATSYGGGRAGYVWRTDDGGRTFSAPVTLLSGQYCDHPWLATGTGQTPSECHVYVVWAAGNKSALGFTRSTDAGETFEAPRTILADEAGITVLSAGPALAAGPNGLVCAACDRTTRLDPSGEVVSQVVTVCSTDAGRTFGPPVVLGPESPIISLPGDVMPVGSPAVAAAPDGHSLYVAFTRHQPGAMHSDIVVSASHDGGRTWSEAVPATPSDDVLYFQPNLTVDQAGRVAICAFALANGHVDVVLLVSPPWTLRFGPPRRVTTAAFDPAHSPTNPGKHGAWWIGDYQGIASNDAAFHLVWNDTRTGKLELFAATVRP
jgi:hypothetical protein